MSKDNLDTLLPVIQAIPTDEVKAPRMPIDAFVQEAEDLLVWSKEDRPALKRYGITEGLLAEMPVRIGALSYAQSLWNKARLGPDEARMEWNQRSPAAFALKDHLEYTFRFAFRNKPDLLTVVKAIGQGSSNADMIQDLNDLAILGKANLLLLKAINHDITELDQAAQLSEDMAILLAKLNAERNKSNSDKIIRDRAYTYLKQGVDEIRATGKYVNRKNKYMKKGYIRKLYR